MSDLNQYCDNITNSDNFDIILNLNISSKIENCQFHIDDIFYYQIINLNR